MSKKIIVRPKNPLDITPEEAEELAKAIHVSCPKYKVQVKINGYKGYAVTWYEVIEIAVVSGLTEEVIRLISKVAIDWARERFKQKQSGRPKAITIFGPKGEVLKSLVVKNATDEPEDRTKGDVRIEEIAKKYRKAPFWQTNYHRLKGSVSKLWHQIKTSGVIIGHSFSKILPVVVRIDKFLDWGLGQIKALAVNLGFIFLIPGFLVVISVVSLFLAGVLFEIAVLSTLLSLGLALISVGLGLISVGMSVKSDKRQTELLEKLDKNVARLPLLFKGDILTPPGQAVVKELLEEQREEWEEQSKEAAQKRLDDDTRRVGFVRGELFQNKDGSWSIHWGGKYPL